MTARDILTLRLRNQRLTGTFFKKVEDVVRWFGAVQAQDYSGAKWAVSQRMQNTVDADIEQAFSEGKILRTHVMRPTWHFVHPADIRWMLSLTAPRIKKILAFYDRTLEIDDSLLKKSNAVIEKALEGHKYLTRLELAEKLDAHNIKARGQRLGHIVSHAELDAVICSGPRRGKQFTYARLEERAPKAKELTPEEVLAELVKRYFISHGPATLQDFAWWSGLTMKDARAGIEMVKSRFTHEIIDGHTYWYAPSAAAVMPKAVYLLPNYDEYTIAYKVRGAYFDPKHTIHLGTPGNAAFAHAIVINGRINGMWRRTLTKDGVTLHPKFFTKLSSQEHKAFTQAAHRYSKFLGLPVSLS